MKRPSDGHPREPQPQDEHAKDARAQEDEIDQALADSFPASDAPPWTLGVKSPPSKGIGKEKRQRG
jgi:hypothetical protein